MANGNGECPFYKVQCKQSLCELWNGNQCSIYKMTYMINDIDNIRQDVEQLKDDVQNLLTYLENVLGTKTAADDLIPHEHHDSRTFTDIRSTLINLLKHLNKDHDDQYLSAQTAASMLMSEHMMGEDMDNDGRIYLKDFRIKDSDTKPQTLKQLELNIENADDLKYLTWEEYHNWYQDKTQPIPPLHDPD